MSANPKPVAPAFRPPILIFPLLILMAAATGDSAWARTRQQCSVAYARCINRAIDKGRGAGTLINCDTMASSCFSHASDAKALPNAPGKVKALQARRIPVVQSGSLRRR
jgi:hypothetical protein